MSMPFSLETSSLTIGAFVGAVTAVTQPAAELNVISDLFGSPMGSAIVAALVAYGTIKTSVKIMERDLQEMRRDVKDIGKRVARIEGRLEIIHTAEE